jgi:tmRNA-binding protein
MEKKIRQGQFEVIDSFAIMRRSEFYLIGQVIEGVIQENWFINVPLNPTLAITFRITAIEDILISSEKTEYKLIVIHTVQESLDLLLALKVGSEFLDITIEGED